MEHSENGKEGCIMITEEKLAWIKGIRNRYECICREARDAGCTVAQSDSLASEKVAHDAMDAIDLLLGERESWFDDLK